MAPDTDPLDFLREQLVASGAPPEVLKAFDDADDLEQVMQLLTDLGVAPPAEDAVLNLVAHWDAMVRPGTTALDAELFGLEFLRVTRATALEPADLPAVLVDLADQAEEIGSPAALALLRFLAALSPAEVRRTAGEAADRLVAAGLKDRPWVATLGNPKVGPCFGYGGSEAGQESIALTFTYGRQSHALVILIDHDLGGGVKDCFPTERPDMIRAQYEQVTDQYGLPFREYEPQEAHAIMAQALKAPPCPAQPDQIEDIDTYLDLLRARVDLLVTAPSAPPAATSVLKVKVTLRGAKPPIWRRLAIPATASLAELHEVIQAAFGWQNYHLWVFETPAGNFGLPDPDIEHVDASRTTLLKVAPRPGDRIGYTYDFGDVWDHDILIEDVSPAAPDVRYPRCLAGRRAGPPEDCGGIWGYAALLEVLADPHHEDHSRTVDWLGLDSANDFDPARFDIDDINHRLS